MADRAHDAVIVGAGAGGGACAWALTRRGARVLVLDAGPRFDPFKDYRLDTPQWQQSFPHKPGSQGKYSYAPLQPLAKEWDTLRSWNRLSGRLNPSDVRVAHGYQHVRGVGGSSLHFTGEAHRLNPRSMQMRSRFGVAADWPFSYDELEAYYLRAEKIVGVAGPRADPFRPRSAPYPLPSHPLSYATKLLQKGFDRKHLRLTENAVAVLSRPREGRAACNYCNGCLKGCPRTDKGSIDVTYLREAEASGRCEIRPGSIATRVETNADDSIRGVHYRQQGNEHFVSASIVILAGGVIETPRLLLASQDARSPQGLANESGQVGRNFMETLVWTTNALHPDPLGSHRGLPVDAICWDYNAPDAIPDVIGGCRIAPSIAESDLLGPVSYAQRVVGGWGHSHKQAMRTTFGRALSLSGLCESLPHRDSYVDLDPQVKDDSGVPVARIHSFVDEMATRRIAFMAKLCREIMGASGARDIFEEFGSYDIFSSTHVFGTCRMGKDAGDSVVNAECRSHRWKNLYIADGSVFPSSGGGEAPGLTIQALALRAVDRMKT